MRGDQKSTAGFGTLSGVVHFKGLVLLCGRPRMGHRVQRYPPVAVNAETQPCLGQRCREHRYASSAEPVRNRHEPPRK
jgi:hypothetical protein